MPKQDPSKPRHFPAAGGHTLTVWGDDPADPSKGAGANLHFGDATTNEEAWLATRLHLGCQIGADGVLRRLVTADDGTGRASQLTIILDPDGKSSVSLNIAEAGEEPAYLRIPFADLLRFGRQQVDGPEGVERVVYDGPGGTMLVASVGQGPKGRPYTGAVLALGDPREVDKRGRLPCGLMLHAYAMEDGSTSIGATYHEGAERPGPVATILDEDGTVTFSVDVSTDHSGDLRQLDSAQVVALAREHGGMIKPTVGVMRPGPFFTTGA